MRLTVLDIPAVAERRLCCGCGGCAAAAPDLLTMGDVTREGRRPQLRADVDRDEPRLGTLLAACPGAGLDTADIPASPDADPRLRPDWGPVVEVWEGHATDDTLRGRAGSGGVTSALALHAIERGGHGGVLHIGARDDTPYLNEAVYSTTREELLTRVGARYAPASPIEGLGQLTDPDHPSVVIGKPCDIAAARGVGRVRPDLSSHVGLTIAIFCAGTPTLEGTFEMLRQMGIDDPDTLTSLRYRGHGWPGRATATFRTERGERTRSLSYAASWSDVLARHKQWRCQVCVDHTGEFADIAIGDPWYQTIAPGDPGRSLVVVRNERGRAAVHAAIKDGYVHLTRVDSSVIAASQPALLKARGSVWGRVLACRLLGMPAPVYRGFPTFAIWATKLPVTAKLRSLVGTARRILWRGLRHPVASPVANDGLEAPVRKAA